MLDKIRDILNQIPRRGGNSTEALHCEGMVDLLNKNLSLFKLNDKPELVEKLTVLIWAHDLGEIEHQLSEDAINIFNEYLSTEDGYWQSFFLEAINLFTRLEGETSEQHFQRMLNSEFMDLKYVLIVKCLDCWENLSYTNAERKWHEEFFGEDCDIAKEKYRKRRNMIVDILNTKYFI